TLAAGDMQSNLRLWRVATGKLLHEFQGDVGSVTAVRFSPDGRTLASATAVLVQLWDVATAREIRRFAGGERWGKHLAFTPDGSALVSASEDRTALVWAGIGAPPIEAAHGWAPEEADALWTDLAEEDAARAYDAVCALAAAPGQAMPFLRQRLRPVRPLT